MLRRCRRIHLTSMKNMSPLLETTAEKKKSEIENMLKNVLKEDEVFKIMYKNEISLNFKHWRHLRDLREKHACQLTTTRIL